MEVYTDGSCLGNPGPGGWALWIPDLNATKSGGDPRTTNNRMELTAIIQALKHYKIKTVYTDSVYCKNGITKWCEKWKRNGWKTAKGDEVKNRDLWEQLVDLSEDVEFRWVKAHAKNPHNNKVDLMAREEANQLKQT